MDYVLKDPSTNDAPHPAPVLAYINDHGFTDIANMDSSPFEFILAIPGAPLTAPIFLDNDANAKHVSWYVELLSAGTSSSLPLRALTQGIIYTINANNDLLWYRHDGRNDGSFAWADNNARKIGVGWDVKQVFSEQ